MSMSKKLQSKLVLLAFMLIPFIFSFCISRFVCDCGNVYSLCMAFVAVIAGDAFGRMFLHLLDDSTEINFWASFGWQMGCAVAWLFCVLTESMDIFKICTGAAVFCAINSIGFACRQPAEQEEGTATVEVPVATESDLERMKKSLKFAFVDDDITKSADLDRPLCLINDQAYTANEAEAMGYGALAANAIEYIKAVLK